MGQRWDRFAGEVGRFLAVGLAATIVALILFNFLVHGFNTAEESAERTADDGAEEAARKTVRDEPVGQQTDDCAYEYPAQNGHAFPLSLCSSARHTVPQAEVLVDAVAHGSSAGASPDPAGSHRVLQTRRCMRRPMVQRRSASKPLAYETEQDDSSHERLAAELASEWVWALFATPASLLALAARYALLFFSTQEKGAPMEASSRRR
jgi:hypothetical protein